MPWGSLAGIKEWLTVAASNTQYDSELANAQTYVNRQISLVLKGEAVDPSSLSSELTAELSDVENQWAAAVFRLRRDPEDAKAIRMLESAMKDLDRFTHNHFHRGFFKTSSKTVKTALRSGKSSVSGAEL